MEKKEKTILDEETVEKEVKETDKEKKTKRKIWKTIGNIIFWLVFVVFVYCAVTSYINFKKVDEEKEPSGYREKRVYAEDNDHYTVYDYYVYKIVKLVDNKGIKVSLKLWFLED